MNIQNQPLTPTPEQDTLIRLLASRFVRRENRFYHIENPTEPMSQRDVIQSFINILRLEHPDVSRSPDNLKLVFKLGIEQHQDDQRRTIPYWGGQIRSFPGNRERLVWNDSGSVTINSWKKPEYRQHGTNRAVDFHRELTRLAS